MTTPDDTPDDTTRRTDRTTDRTTGSEPAERSDRTASPQPIPGRIPPTEEAGAPLVPTITTRRTTGTRSPGSPPRADTRRPTRPPTDDERDAPMVPDLRPASRTRTDGGSR
ncbi:hypothetical protein PM076_08745 [Halorubrum ezzemoulense]|jgi:hypothetical protein|uniref:Uncharacterized protein n=1 Tax=Halorubrum ezzemoulense TaxID=337243 RepID=A0A256IQI3_HALEZ|nr:MULTISPECIES: hypothetical protein [Halorubrum]MDB2223190.1 hypothetical protein [Halorubrum ezzemoulense]MDB2237844.1 hypothetical protein [Halorubrum ezzemoulense]MDB2243560.1 hypothetical protein [Halorubrum ezzemoulense]MDB2248662.1 hypothetical protein [Halorubrum ezzemoulense]MDB2251626.1 hypothetical protein [Halorubrum ezzemoulense]